MCFSKGYFGNDFTSELDYPVPHTKVFCVEKSVNDEMILEQGTSSCRRYAEDIFWFSGTVLKRIHPSEVNFIESTM